MNNHLPGTPLETVERYPDARSYNPRKETGTTTVYTNTAQSRQLTNPDRASRNYGGKRRRSGTSR